MILPLLFVLLTASAGFFMGRLACLIIGRTAHSGRQVGQIAAAATALVLGGLLVLSFIDGGDDWKSEVADASPRQAPSYGPASEFQFDWDSIRVPGAHRWEPRRSQISVDAASDYLEMGTRAWAGRYRCIGCHTTGMYLLVRPMLTGLGPPPPETREFALQSLRPYLEEGSESIARMGHRPAQVVYAAAGLASWDAHLSRKLSPETGQLLGLMFRLQEEDGAWEIPSSWPPLQSSRFQLATVAALAAGLASGCSDEARDLGSEEGLDRLSHFLKTCTPPHDYSRVWLLWAGAYLDGLLDNEARGQLIDLILRHQNRDGGWSLRSFAAPEAWGQGERADKLVSDLDFYMPTSDGHMTGLAVVALTEAGFPYLDSRIQRAIAWIDANQRISGRWWTASLNTDRYHFITYSATCFALLSLWRCHALSRPNP